MLQEELGPLLQTGTVVPAAGRQPQEQRPLVRSGGDRSALSVAHTGVENHQHLPHHRHDGHFAFLAPRSQRLVKVPQASSCRMADMLAM